MRTIPKVGFLLLWISVVTVAQRPDWVKDLGKSASYPEQIYLTGFGMHKVAGGIDRAASLRKATESARGNLIQSVRVSLRARPGR